MQGHPRRAAVIAALLVPLLGACAALGPGPAPAVARYRLAPAPVAHAALPSTGPVIAVDPPAAVPGLGGRGMAYVTQRYRIAYFARHGWIAPPARMLEPLLVAALRRRGGLRAVPASVAVAAGLRLDTRILALQQEFTARPSRERVAVRAWLIDARSGRLVATRVFTAVAPAPQDDPYGGVQAANRAVADVLDALAAFCRAQVRARVAAPAAPGAAASPRPTPP